MRLNPAVLRSESGQAVIVTAVMMAVIIGFLGLGIDVGNLRYAKRKLQLAADAAATAAGMEIYQCGATVGC